MKSPRLVSLFANLKAQATASLDFNRQYDEYDEILSSGYPYLITKLRWELLATKSPLPKDNEGSHVAPVAPWSSKKQVRYSLFHCLKHNWETFAIYDGLALGSWLGLTDDQTFESLRFTCLLLHLYRISGYGVA